jgi:myo-inositol 2-dehydrogenase / D-chiro-inositol 1-dehydrogenase
MTQVLRYGIIGAGLMAREHIRNLALIPGSIVTAIADPDPASRADAAMLAGGSVNVFTSNADLIASGLADALIIASPNDTHAGILLEIFAAAPSLPVLVEKPVCTRAEDVAPLAAAAILHRAPIWVAMEYRYMPPVAELIREVRQGTIGRLQMLSIREHRHPFLHKVGDWNRFNARTGGTMVEKCCHFFDLMRLIVDDEPVRVYCSGAADVNHRDERYDGRTPDIIDNAFTVVDFKSGARAALDLCMFAEGGTFQEEMSATGDKARAEAFIPGGRSGHRSERAAEIEISPRFPQAPARRPVHVDAAILNAGSHHGSTYYEHLGFRRAVLEGGRVEVTMLDGLKAVVMGLAAERSIKQRRAVAIHGLEFV